LSFTTVERIAPVRIYRSKLFVPGSKINFFEKAAAGAADCVCLDLEDAVAPADKDKARGNVVAALNEVVWRSFSETVWVNFKVFGILGLSLVFAMAQFGLIRRHEAKTGT